MHRKKVWEIDIRQADASLLFFHFISTPILFLICSSLLVYTLYWKRLGPLLKLYCIGYGMNFQLVSASYSIINKQIVSKQ